MHLRPFRPEDQSEVIALWQRCDLTRPWNDPVKDIARKLTVQPELFLVVVDAPPDGRIIASAMAGYDGHRGWINYLAVAPEHQRSGIGRMLMAEIERRLLALGCPKANLQIRSSNQAAVGFYEALGYTPDAAITMGKRLESDL